MSLLMKKTLLAFSLLFTQPLMAIEVSYTSTAIIIDGVDTINNNSC